jgi:hypothetical protein
MDRPDAQTDQASDPNNPSRNDDGYDSGYKRDRVALRAYELYLARGGGDGGDFDDWLAAEREVGGNGSAGRGDAGE